MYTASYRLLQGRTLVALVALLILPVTLAGAVSRAAPAGQTPPPADTPTPTAGKPILLIDPVPDPHQDGVTFFPETGHTLRGKFLAYWQKNGGLPQFGYPLTEEFFEPDGPNNALLQVQYFERNRFELHPENQPPYDVLLSILGREFRQQDPPAPPEASSAIYFPETGHNLPGEFLQYWQAHGGLAVNGYPITEPQMETSTDGRQYLTQWFERSRFELHSENSGSPYEVELGQLGRQLSEKRGYPYAWYPGFGRAADYSWIAGYVELYLPGDCMFPSCGCSRFQFSAADDRVQLNRAGGLQYLFPKRVQGKDLRVVFGRLAARDEATYTCSVDTTAIPVYFVTSIQENPTQP